MILAVADYAEGDKDELPLELKYALQARTYNILPNSGGLREQSAGLMIKMGAAYNVWNAFNQYKSAGFDPKWISKNSELWDIIAQVAIIRERIDEANEEG